MLFRSADFRRGVGPFRPGDLAGTGTDKAIGKPFRDRRTPDGEDPSPGPGVYGGPDRKGLPGMRDGAGPFYGLPGNLRVDNKSGSMV